MSDRDVERSDNLAVKENSEDIEDDDYSVASADPEASRDSDSCQSPIENLLKDESDASDEAEEDVDVNEEEEEQDADDEEEEDHEHLQVLVEHLTPIMKLNKGQDKLGIQFKIYLMI